MSKVTEITEGEIDRLAALQELDRRLKDNQEQLDTLISQASDFEGAIDRQRVAVESLTAERDALEAQRADMDARLETAGGRIRDNRMRLNRVRNSTELLALQREIDLGKEANQHLEEEILVVMECIENLNAQLNSEKEALQGLEGQAETEITKRREEAETLRREVDIERGRRDELARGMNAELRGKYEQIFQRRGGTAVVAARQGTCTGCHMNLPPQLFNELQRYRDVRQCPNCHRILFWRPGPEPGSEVAQPE